MYLLDTHAIIWFFNEPELIPSKTLEIIQDSENKIFYSLISLWEISIKLKINKLKINRTVEELNKACLKSGFELISMKIEHLTSLEALDLYHHDPFDRFLVSIASTENLTIITKDKSITPYPISILWQ